MKKQLYEYDLKTGIMKYVWIYGLILPFILIYAAQYQHEAQAAFQISHITIGDLLFYLWDGIRYPVEQTVVSIPFRYLLLLILPVFMTAVYPCKEWKERGSLIFPRVKNAGHWWLSKCLWLVSSLFCYVLIFFVGINISALLFGIEFSFSTGKATEYFYGMTEIHSDIMVLRTLLLPGVLLLGLCMFQMLVSLACNIVIGFIMQIIVLVASLLIRGPLSIGSYFMMLRADIRLQDGMSFGSGMVIGAGMAVISILIGYGLIRKKDIF